MSKLKAIQMIMMIKYRCCCTFVQKYYKIYNINKQKTNISLQQQQQLPQQQRQQKVSNINQ